MSAPAWRRNAAGQILCTACGGDKTIEIALGHPNDPGAPVSTETCGTCDGSGVEPCCDCGEPAVLCGESGEHFYCGVEHGFTDANWPACVGCEQRAQHATLAPFCGEDCQRAFEVKVAAARAAADESRALDKRWGCGCPDGHATLESWEAAHGEAFSASETNELAARRAQEAAHA